MKSTKPLALLALGIALAACGDEVPLAPTGDLTPPNVQPAAHPAATTNGYGARVLREEQLCFLPGIAADGAVFLLEDVPCKVQITLTNNHKGGANGWIKAVVPNESGRAFRTTFADPPHVPCVIAFDTDGDGMYDIWMTTSQYILNISATGQTRLTCHFPEGDEGIPIPQL